MTLRKALPWFILAAVVAFALGAWLLVGRTALDAKQTDDRLQVMTSLPLLADLAARIGGREVSVASVIQGSACSHEYEPSAGDMKRVARCAVFIKAGQGFDTWVDRLVASAGKQGASVIDASVGIAVIEEDEEREEGEEGRDEEGEHHQEPGNPHYWGSPENVKIAARNILAGLVKARPEKEEYFRANCQEYLAQLDKAAADLKERVSALKDKRLVSYSAAFPYFFAYFGFECVATVEDACEEDVSPRRMAEVAKLIEERRIKAIVGEAVYPALPGGLAEETGARSVLLWPATDETGEYLHTLKANLEKLVKALDGD